MQPAPKAHQDFVTRFPAIGEAWRLLQQAGGEGPLDERAQRLIKLAIAAGALREGAVHSAVRKAVAAGCQPAELEQVVALAASTIGLPSAVAIHTWIKDELEQKPPR